MTEKDPLTEEEIDDLRVALGKMRKEFSPRQFDAVLHLVQAIARQRDRRLVETVKALKAVVAELQREAETIPQ
jgi:ABC-type transporter Mla subunit MlaD